MIPAKENSNKSRKAVIYARADCSLRSENNHCLAEQYEQCAEYAQARELEVVQVFTDEKTGSLTERPSMNAMLAFLRQHREKQSIVVIVDDISRLARKMDVHLKLQMAIQEAGGILKSPSLDLEEGPDSKHCESVLAALHERQSGAERIELHRKKRQRDNDG